MPLPEGQVAMLFSDIEGSTRLLRTLGTDYPRVLSDQRQIIREAIRQHDGHEMGTEGDSFFVVFASPSEAVAAAVRAQRGLDANAWPDGAQVRVRMGLHVGDLARHEEGYVGLELNRAARIASTANGAQVVISGPLATTVQDALPPGVALRDLGRHRLKDLLEPEAIFQLVVGGLPDITTPIKSLGAPSNLPRNRSPLVGRGAEIADVETMISEGCRLVTLTGPGGVGKTSVALTVAGRAEEATFEGVYFVRLEEARELDQAWALLAIALGYEGDESGTDAAIAVLGPGRVLLVLDNLEQLGDAGLLASTLLDRTGCTILATSRGPLRVRAEREFTVGPLALPGDAGSVEAVSASPAVELFVREAQRVRTSFELSTTNAAVVASICSTLQGLPLALELASSRLRLLSPDALEASLAEHLSIASRDVDRPDRQRTLSAAIAWSYDLLDPPHQDAFVRLGVFAGGCDVDAASFLLRSEPAINVLAVLDALADLSLIGFVDAPDGGTRVSMLRSVREFAQQRLRAREDAERIRCAHATHFTALAEEAGAQLRGPRQLAWSDRLTLEQDNLRAAFEWCTQPEGDPELALRLASALGWFWYTHGRSSEGRAWLERAVSRQPADADPGTRARALHALGVLQQQQGSNDQAAQSFEQALELWRAQDDRKGIAQELNSLGVTRWAQGRLEAAQALLDQSASLARQLGDDQRLASALSNLGLIALALGAVNDAIARFQEALQLDQQLEDTWAVAVDKANLGAAFLRDGELQRGHALLMDVLPTAVGLDDPDLLASAVEACAMAAGASGHPHRAALLAGGADSIRAAASAPRAPLDDAWLERELGPARAALGGPAFGEALVAGGALPLDDLLATAQMPL